MEIENRSISFHQLKELHNEKKRLAVCIIGGGGRGIPETAITACLMSGRCIIMSPRLAVKSKSRQKSAKVPPLCQRGEDLSRFIASEH